MLGSGQCERNGQSCVHVNRCAAASGWPEPHLAGGIGGCFVESVAETPNHAQNLNGAVCAKGDLEQDLAFNLQIACFGRILGLRLEKKMGFIDLFVIDHAEKTPVEP